MFNRKAELAALNQQLKENASRRKSAFVLVYGRRRVGKSTLLKSWAISSGRPYIYWQADQDLAEVHRRSFLAKALGLSQDQAPRVDSWGAAFDLLRVFFAEKSTILIFDEAPYLAQSDRNFYAAMQKAWDEWMQASAMTLVVCGSHVRAMDTLFLESSPLFGRITLPLYVEPLAFTHLREFFPHWSAEERVAAYAMLGGIPEYYEWLDERMSLVENLQTRVIQKPSPFLTEARFLLHDQLEQPAAHLSVLKAIGSGHHTFEALRLHSEGTPTKLSVYLDRLRDLRLVERSVSALIRPQRRRDAKDSRWILTDPYLRFYFQFIAPALELDVYNSVELSAMIWSQMRSFVGRTAFEEISREWVRQSVSNPGRLPFVPEVVGRHAGKDIEADVVAVSWSDKHLLVGECKWQQDKVTLEQVRKLISQTLPGVLEYLKKQEGVVFLQGWTTSLAFFSRAGFTSEALRALKQTGAITVDLKRLDNELQ